ncbi:MAG TPA: ATP-dependent metallopeptidase FtsH/Yme1/Tma family protein [Deltaproteobacteria bacterium]|nr:ATP-dependent metallopeptidase FtsH/Yme1/Tma family protein [Candidatus Binatota bacterium]HIL13887.1 ATP-dependent metallopeptidase FtsH/Yme1/Tma family protein [Deltaproteobacteria bacterium]
MNQFSRNIALWLVLGLMVVLLFNMFQGQQQTDEKVIYSDFIEELQAGRVDQVTLQGDQISGTMDGGRNFTTYGPLDDAVDEIKAVDVPFEVKPQANEPWYVILLVQWFPMLLLVGVWIFFMRQMQMGGGKAMSFGKSRARLLNENEQKVTFGDVAGIDEAKEELEEIIAFLRDPKKFTRLGGRIPKGVLLVGAPGTGKTLLARAVAGEAGVPFYSISGSDFVEMFVGVGASRVRDLFVQGKKNAPCIIFIDEIDAVGRHRGAGLGGGHDEREQTLNQLLVEMDGFESNEGVILVAATNRPDVLDPALLRPGRFDRRIVVPQPDVRGRTGILKVHTRKVPLGDDVDLSVIGRATPGFSGADLESLVNEAALQAARENKDAVCQPNFDHAKDKILMGSERRSLVMTDEEKRNTAYHESGHALIAALLPGADPVHKVTIIPRGMALGLTQQIPVEDRHSYNRRYLNNNLVILYGGRVAEEIVMDEVTTGAGNDLERATELARKMVCEWGMSESMGPVTYSTPNEEVFLGMDITQRREYSEATAGNIDAEVRNILSGAYKKARKILDEHLAILHKMAAALLEHEVLDNTDIQKLLREGGVEPPVVPEPAPVPA